MSAWQKPSTGLELLLCSCENELMIVLTEDEKLLCFQSWDAVHRGTEILAPVLQQMFPLAGVKLENLRRIGCVRGPGSFTGIRLCLATAAALRRTTRAQLAGLDYLQALATTVAMGEQLLYGRRIWVFTHARRNLVHAACHACFGPVIPCYATAPVELVSPAEALRMVEESIRQSPDPVYVCGSGLVRNKGLHTALEGLDGCIARPQVTTPSVDALRLLGRHGDYFPKDIEPLYVRPCDAVQNLPDLASRMGRNADAVVGKLDELLKEAPHSEI